MGTTARYVKNLAFGKPAVKAVECRICGAEVGLVEGSGGKWYTCQLTASASPDSGARRAMPWVPHKPECGRRAEQRGVLAEAYAQERKLVRLYTATLAACEQGEPKAMREALNAYAKVAAPLEAMGVRMAWVTKAGHEHGGYFDMRV